MPLPEGVTRLIAGSGIADRTGVRKIQKEHEAGNTAEAMKAITEVNREALPSPPQVQSRATDPLPRRRPRRPSVQVLPESVPAANTEDATIDDAPSSASSTELPPLPEMEGVGRYRMAKNATEEHRISTLRRALSDMTPKMIEEFANLGIADSRLIREAATRPVGPTSPFRVSKSVPSQQIDPPSYVEYVDSRRGSLVQRGFSPSNSSSPSSSANEGIMLRNRKNSSLSMTSISSDGQPKSRRKLARQVSAPLPESELPLLRTIQEITRPSEIASSAQLRDLENAIASDDEDDLDTNVVLGSGPAKPRALNQGLMQERRRSSQRGRPRGRVRVAPTRGGHSPQRRSSRQVRFRESPDRSTEANTDSMPPDTWETVKSDDPKFGDRVIEQGESATVARGEKPCDKLEPDHVDEDEARSEAGDAPSDLALFMIEGPGKDRNDDNASATSASTAKTTIPWPRQVYNKVAKGVRRRSSTVLQHPKVSSGDEKEEKGDRKADI